MTILSILPQRTEQRRLLVGHTDRNLHRIKLLSERWPNRLFVDVVLEATNADFSQVGLVLVVHLNVHLEADRVKQFQ